MVENESESMTTRDVTNPKRWGGLGEERRSLPPN
jgi:hypothetical protein